MLNSIKPANRRPAYGCGWFGRAALALLIAGMQLGPALAAPSPIGGSPVNEDKQSLESGPIRLTPRTGGASPGRKEDSLQPRPDGERGPVIQVPNEFESYVQSIVGRDMEIRRFGASLMASGGVASMTDEAASQIPSDYLLGVGDEVLLTIWGSVEADLRLTVDRSGRIAIPRVGPVMVAGVRYADLTATVEQRVAQVFRNFKLSASLGRLRSIRIYMTGFVQRPGAYTVSSLSTLVNAVMQSGGPTAAGSFRQIELRRGGKLLSHLDLYDLLIRGDKSADRVLQPGDVIHIGPIRSQVAMIGSVNNIGIFEITEKETIHDLLNMAGGFTAVADRSRVLIERLEQRTATRIAELALPQDGSQHPRAGDVLRAVSAISATLPQHRQNKRVRVEGEVQRPGDYILPPNSTMGDAIKAAGGLTSGAFIFGTEFSRDSVRSVQEANYDRALRDLETEFTRSATTQKAVTGDEANAQAARAAGVDKLIERLRSVRPTGRIVLQLSPNSTILPDLAVEDGDRLLIPARPTTVGVFGSVFNGGSYLFGNGGSVTDYLKLAGGPTRGADTNSVFVLRANGSVISSRQKSGWFMAGGALDGIAAEPGDTIFVPEELNKTSFVQEAKEWTQILYQFGLGAAALKTIKN